MTKEAMQEHDRISQGAELRHRLVNSDLTMADIPVALMPALMRLFAHDASISTISTKALSVAELETLTSLLEKHDQANAAASE
jgi:hypothetical protein